MHQLQLCVGDDRGDRGKRWRQSIRTPGNKDPGADFPLGSLRVGWRRMPWQLSGQFKVSKNDHGMNIDRDVARMAWILTICLGNKFCAMGAMGVSYFCVFHPLGTPLNSNDIVQDSLRLGTITNRRFILEKWVVQKYWVRPWPPSEFL